MAYTITYSGGTFTVADGTINTSNTSISLPGRNFSGYGQPVDQSMVSMLENFASATSGPSNSIPGQFWYDSTNTLMKYNIGTVGSPNWVAVLPQGGNATFNNLIVTGSGTPPNNYGLQTTKITTGDAATAGSITGTWTLTPGSTLQATYADLAERFESDQAYDAGTVVEIGGEKEITYVREDSSDRVFGVISNTAAYLMNSAAGTNTSHPPVAVSGRVKVKVKGSVKKGDRLISAGNGVARSASTSEATAFNTIGRALEDKNSSDVGTVLAFVSLK
jgi:hypothetical protein